MVDIVKVEWRKKKGFNPEIIINKLVKQRIINGDKVEYEDILEYFDLIKMLDSILEFDNISSEISYGIVKDGFDKAALKIEITPSIVLKEIKEKLRVYLKQKKQKYYLITTINIDHSNKLPSFVINNSCISFYQYLPKKYQFGRRKALNDVSHFLIKNDVNFEKFIVISTKARSETDAVNRMLNSIDLLRGIWNLFDQRKTWRSFTDRPRPLNKIILGALRSLHNENGSLVSDTHWYDPDYCDVRYRYSFSSNSYKEIDFTKYVRKQLKSSNYGNELERAIVRYVKALDYSDYEVSFVKLWGILEQLTSTGDSYEKTIRRTSFLYKDSNYYREELKILRHYRNRTVHAGLGENNDKTYLRLLKKHVEVLLMFHIRNRFKFKDLDEAGKFMDLAPNVEELEEVISFMKQGVEYRG